MTDWRSYDTVAYAYDRLWAPRFLVAARHLVDLACLAPGLRLLDVGTGTGVVAEAARQQIGDSGYLIGCDVSLAMLKQARVRVPAVSVVAAEANRLPFRPGVFDIITANFVLSHLRDYGAALAEIFRVLCTGSRLVATAWGSYSDPFEEAWRELLADEAGREALQKSSAEVIPWEEFFRSQENLAAALIQAGFESVRVEPVEIEFNFSREEYLASRELSASGRFARENLSPAGWERFLRRAQEEFARSFPESLSYLRTFLIAVGVKPMT